MFKISRNQDTSGSSLETTLPHVTDAMVQRVFGISYPDQNEEKYSDAFVVESAESGFRYTLYKSHGQWRIGGWRLGSQGYQVNTFDVAELTDLLETAED
jgi:hypothetical protein